MYAQVIVDVPAMQTNQPYTYRIPAELADIVVDGMRVVVPFGRGNRLIQGFVVGLIDEAEDADKLKDIDSVVELMPVLNDELLQLGGWLAETNFSFRISVLQTMLPNVMRAKYSKTLQLVEPEAIADDAAVAFYSLIVLKFRLMNMKLNQRYCQSCNVATTRCFAGWLCCR